MLPAAEAVDSLTDLLHLRHGLLVVRTDAAQFLFHSDHPYLVLFARHAVARMFYFTGAKGVRQEPRSYVQMKKRGENPVPEGTDKAVQHTVDADSSHGARNMLHRNRPVLAQKIAGRRLHRRAGITTGGRWTVRCALSYQKNGGGSNRGITESRQELPKTGGAHHAPARKRVSTAFPAQETECPQNFSEKHRIR